MTHIYTDEDWIKYSKKELVIKALDFLTLVWNYNIWKVLYDDISTVISIDYNITIDINDIEKIVRSNLKHNK